MRAARAVDLTPLLRQSNFVDGVSARRLVDDARNEVPRPVQVPVVPPEQLRPDEAAGRARIEMAPGNTGGLDHPRVRRLGLCSHRIEEVCSSAGARQPRRSQGFVCLVDVSPIRGDPGLEPALQIGRDGQRPRAEHVGEAGGIVAQNVPGPRLAPEGRRDRRGVPGAGIRPLPERALVARVRLAEIGRKTRPHIFPAREALQRRSLRARQRVEQVSIGRRRRPHSFQLGHCEVRQRLARGRHDLQVPVEQELADGGDGDALIVARSGDPAADSLLVRILHQPAQEQMTIARVGAPASGCIGEPAPIGRQKRMQRRLLPSRGESTRGARVPQREREHRLLAAHVRSRRRVGSAERNGVCVQAIVRVERSRQLEHEGRRSRSGVVEDGRPVVAARPAHLRFANRAKRFLLPAHGANLGGLPADLRGGNPLLGERSEGLEQLGKVRQLGDAGDLAIAERHDPSALREASGDVPSCQLLRCEQKPAIRSQPERVVERTAPLDGVRRQRIGLEPEPGLGGHLRGVLLSDSRVLLEPSLPPPPHLDACRRGGAEDAQGDDERDGFHGRVLSRERSR